MTGLLRLLAAILGAHIERDDLPPAELVWPDERPDAPVFDLGEAVQRERRDADVIAAMHAEIDRQRQVVVAAQRPCWACGNEVGFHAEHLPCWNVPPFVRNVQPVARTFADGGLL